MQSSPSLPGKVTLGGHRTLQYEVSGKIADLEMLQLRTTIEIDKNDRHILVASCKPEFERDDTTLETIAQSFQEKKLPPSSSTRSDRSCIKSLECARSQLPLIRLTGKSE